MFDWVDYECDCPKCGATVDVFQTKSRFNQLLKLKPWEVDNFYASCDKCDHWIKFVRKEYSQYEHISPPEPEGWRKEFGIEDKEQDEVSKV